MHCGLRDVGRFISRNVFARLFCVSRSTISITNKSVSWYVWSAAVSVHSAFVATRNGRVISAEGIRSSRSNTRQWNRCEQSLKVLSDNRVFGVVSNKVHSGKNKFNLPHCVRLWPDRKRSTTPSLFGLTKWRIWSFSRLATSLALFCHRLYSELFHEHGRVLTKATNSKRNDPLLVSTFYLFNFRSILANTKRPYVKVQK